MRNAMSFRIITLKAVGEFQAKGAPVLNDTFLKVFRSTGKSIFLIEEVMNAGGDFEMLYQFVAEQGPIREHISPSALMRRAFRSAGVLKLDATEDLVPING